MSLKRYTMPYEKIVGWFNPPVKDEEEIIISTEEYGEKFTLDELTFAGLDPTELELMDDSDRREAILNAGLDPNDFDF